jgi:hypothetical protein
MDELGVAKVAIPTSWQENRRLLTNLNRHGVSMTLNGHGFSVKYPSAATNQDGYLSNPILRKK